MMEKVSDFYDRIIMTQVCVRKPITAVLSHGKVHTLWPALPFCESQLKFSQQSEAVGNCWSVFQQSEVGGTPHKMHSFASCCPSIFTTHTTLLWDISNSRKRASSMPQIPKTSPFRFLRVLFKDGPNQRSDLYAQTANPLSEKNLFSNERI